MDKLLLLGNQAFAQGAIDAGLSGMYAYPGTPSTEIGEYIQESKVAIERNIHRQWSSNEKTAMEAALGMSFMGKRSIVCMKHVGLNVAADAFVNSGMTGANGGLLVFVADDPSMHSSQNEQDSRFYAKFAFLPILEPRNQQEAYDVAAYGFELSEKIGLPVLVRMTTRLAHSRAVVNLTAIREQNEISYPKNPKQWVLMPANSRARYNVLLEDYAELGRIAETSPFNKYIDAPNKKMGIIACGIAYNYLMENFDGECDYPVIKISQYPLPMDMIRRMAQECESIMVMEEGQPLVEEQLRGLLDNGIKVLGRLSGELPRVGELNPDYVSRAFNGEVALPYPKSENVASRPPALCPGCGHRDVYEALNDVLRQEHQTAKVFSDIGCYTLGFLPPFRAIDTVVEMGASITMAKGAADAGQFPSVAVIGDSTFTHSGMTGLLDAVNENSNIVVVISDNLTTGMTGGQDSAGTGRIESICRGLGVEESHVRVFVPLPKNREAMKEIIREEIAYNGVSVLIPRRECIQTAMRNLKKKKK
ncbi:MAG: thiamine pyrophosphate-dependent enzyme [Rikenellaceae bacterium]